MSGILVSIAIASFIAVQAAKAGADRRITVPVAAVAAGFMAAFWALAIETLFPAPDLWERVPVEMAKSFAFAAIGAGLLTLATGNLIGKITRFKEKYPER
ncbi:MAG: hypothetical protein AAF074_01245 [Pseudomonadota bacterium]